MSHLTWHFITPPPLGWLFGNMVLPRFVSMWQGMFGRDMIADECGWLLNNGFGTCIRLVLHHYFYRTDLTTSTVPVARHSRVRARGVSRSLFRHGAMSPSFVSCCELDTASPPRFAVPVALEPRRAPSTSWPRTSHRRPPFFSAVHHATSVRRPELHLHQTV